jgi:outer membrane biosynthesis protein TonB
MKKLFHPFLLLVTVCLALTLSAPESHAANSAKEAVNEIVSINKQAHKALLSRKYDTAKNLLLQALVIAKDARLDAHDSLARTYIHLAVVVLGRQKDRERVVRVFHQALNINPNITITPGLESPILKSAYLQARKEMGLPPKPDLHAPAPTALPSSDAPSKPAREPEPTREPVAKKTLPDLSPEPALEPSPEPEKQEPKKAPRVTEEEAAPVQPQDDDPLRKIIVSNAEDEDRRLFHRRLPGALFISLAAGTGAGYHGEEYLDSGAKNASQVKAGNSSASKIKAPAGFTPAKVGQIEAEIGFQFSKELWLSALARYQHSPAYSSGGGAKGERPILTSALAAYLRANYAFATWGNFQPYISVGAGIGKHFLLYFPETCKEATPDNKCTLDHSDTISGSSTAVTGALGFMYHLSRGFAIFVEGKEIATLPKFMALSEVNLGMAFAINLFSEKSQSARSEDDEEEQEEPFHEEEPPPAEEEYSE